jgi:hypothetical protein
MMEQMLCLTCLEIKDSQPRIKAQPSALRMKRRAALIYFSGSSGRYL